MENPTVRLSVELEGTDLYELSNLYEHLVMSDFSTDAADAALYKVLKAAGFEPDLVPSVERALQQ